uniref:Green algal specific aspartyl asparaginyl beta-hydroxylase n=1 Tax=Tetraselmis sp. GSL018 TaxID=582737 RepID=A0A061RX66_9CHLO
MGLRRSLPLFTMQQHVNTLSPAGPGRLWAMLHRKGPSEMVMVDLRGRTARISSTVGDVGRMSHGIVHWRGSLLVLDSGNAALLAVDPSTGTSRRLWQSNRTEAPFLKGLAVVDDIAFVGVSAPSRRSQRDDPTLNSEVTAVRLEDGRELWTVELPTHGLLNAISAPLLAPGSGYHANYAAREDDGVPAAEFLARRPAAAAPAAPSGGHAAAEATSAPPASARRQPQRPLRAPQSSRLPPRRRAASTTLALSSSRRRPSAGRTSSGTRCAARRRSLSGARGPRGSLTWTSRRRSRASTAPPASSRSRASTSAPSGARCWRRTPRSGRRRSSSGQTRGLTDGLRTWRP